MAFILLINDKNANICLHFNIFLLHKYHSHTLLIASFNGNKRRVLNRAFTRGIKHAFPLNNIRKVPREMLRFTEGEYAMHDSGRGQVLII